MPERDSDNFGSRLRAARERRGVTLRQISNATKISMAALEALERGDVARLPGGIFSRAFVRSYAIEIGLDPEATIQEFIAQYPRDEVTAGHPDVDHVEDREAHESDQRMASTVLRLVLVSVPLAGLVLYWAAWGGDRRASAVDGTLPREVRADTSVPGVAGSGGVSALVDPAAPVERLEPVPAAAPAPAAELTVTLSAVRSCWISVVADGQPVVERLLAAGEREVVTVRRELMLKAGDASAVTLTLNGRPARSLGGSGEVVTVRLNLENYAEYLASP